MLLPTQLCNYVPALCSFILAIFTRIVFITVLWLCAAVEMGHICWPDILRQLCINIACVIVLLLLIARRKQSINAQQRYSFGNGK
jgi:hypothetical protein